MPTINKPRIKKTSFRRKERQSLYSLKQWRELSKWYRMVHPLCERCSENGQTTPSVHVHHILSPFDTNITQEEQMNRLLDVTNLMALCRECHNEIHGNVKKDKKNSEKEEILES